MNIITNFWKAYFWFVIISFITIVGFVVLHEEKVFFGNIFSRMYDVFFLIIALISMLSIRGYVYKKRYFSKYVWIFLFFIIMVDSLGYIFLEFNYFFTQNSNYLLFSILLLPWYYALYKYTFCMNDLFEDEFDYEDESLTSLISG
ncbi:hypothetical protein [Arcobacter defluvii]|uniref:Membrane protein n=1 Tax=Arcobacter defluvii TaxID=873191 RepID=A0AAE7BGT1_9BACT|nr:hypothetical protein [Arcobacter defluvii]QKF77447.1 putative membrane protein [Arcobacter defluvii]RXI32094.1 hypothetical protein CP964_08955 [Arcobacter defluvii]